MKLNTMPTIPLRPEIPFKSQEEKELPLPVGVQESLNLPSCNAVPFAAILQKLK